MKGLRRSTFATRVVLGAVFVICGLGSSARGQDPPDVKINSPASGSSVTVGPGSAKLPVKFKCNNGYYPTSAKLITNGGVDLYDTTTSFNYDGATFEFTALLSVPSGTTTGVKIVVRSYRPGNSGGQQASFKEDEVTNITTIKQ